VFVSFEGIGGAGKSTQVRLVGELVRADGQDVVLTREPGGTALGERLRVALLEGVNGIAPLTEALLFAAARAELVEEVIAPGLEKGSVVLCDRFIDSSLVYQGLVRGVGVDCVLELNLHATRGLMPDKTFLIQVDVDEAGRRREKTDRIERGERSLRVELDSAYREVAEMFPERIVLLDGMQPAAELARMVRDELRQLS
jgi:dTMP kinase